MNNIEKFENLLRETGKDNIESLIQYYRDSDFYTAWASTSFHCNYEGGLLEHSLNVCNYALGLWEKFKSNVDRKSVIFCALAHDTLANVG